MIRSGFLSVVLGIFLVAAQLGPVQAAPAQQKVQTKTPIEHFLVVMQENHTFDNYFGTYPGADGIPEGVKMPVDPNDPSAGYVEPWHIGNTTDHRSQPQHRDISRPVSTMARWMDLYMP